MANVDKFKLWVSVNKKKFLNNSNEPNRRAILGAVAQVR